jgi:demethylmenaquinone methyltransferase / 2-methoxy-6-polyprenyl-1,4-benzoquinol methylase
LPRAVPRFVWELWVRIGLPAAGTLISPGWREVGSFLGPSIRDFHARYPRDRLLQLWRDAAIENVRFSRLSLGGGIVVSGRRA